MLLAIDTATTIAGLALYDEEGLHVEQMWQTRGNHTVELMPYIVRACEQQGLAPNQLTAVAVSMGPGSFTGLRVGMSVAKGIALAQKIPIVGVSTLDATAYPHRDLQVSVCAVLRAGRGRYAAALYGGSADRWRQSQDVLVSAGQLAALLIEPTLICGEVDSSLADTLRVEAGERVVLASPARTVRRAGYLAELGWQRFRRGDVDNLVSLSPYYLKTE